MERVTVVVAEDHAMVRAGLVEIIGGFEGFEVVGEAATGGAAVAAAHRYKPRAMVLDLDMPDTADPTLPREKTAQEIFRASPETRVVVLSMHEDARTVRALVAAGVSAFLSKTAGPEELHGALSAAVGGDGNVFLKVQREAILGLSYGQAPTHRLLSEREIEILTHVAGGSSNRELARDLHIAEATVKRHLDRIFKKLDVTSRMNAVNRAREHNLI